jgi:poly-gamma-glutamate synthesis protein (capsule biosynthesis protein)
MAETLILAAGDVGARRADLASMFRGCAAALKGADLAFGQLETVISDRGAIVPNARLAMRAPSSSAAALRAAGFGAMSFAGNHCLDWGYEAFGDTLLHAREAGIALCGAGADLAAARQPIEIAREGCRIAILAASSILPEGYAAGAGRAGCAPLRAHTVYEQVEHDQPGTPARIRSYPHRQDLDALCASIRAAKAESDIVLVSLHWGLHMTEAVLADYQRIAAREAIDAGADAIIGHHPHILKAVEVYKDRPIFYSLGNFAIEQPHIWDPSIVETDSFRHLVSLNPSWDLQAAYMLPAETRLTGLAELIVRDRRLDEVRFRPAFIEEDSAPRMLAADEPEFALVENYLKSVTGKAGFATSFERSGGALRLS